MYLKCLSQESSPANRSFKLVPATWQPSIFSNFSMSPDICGGNLQRPAASKTHGRMISKLPRRIEIIPQILNLLFFALVSILTWSSQKGGKKMKKERWHLNSWTPPCFLQPKCPRWKHWPSAKRQSESCGIRLLEWRQRLRNRQSWNQTSKRRNPCVLYVHQSLPAWRTCRRHHTEGNRWSIRLRARAEHYGWANLAVPSAQICPPMPTCQQMPIRRVQTRQRRTSLFEHHGLQEFCLCRFEVEK